MPHCPGDFHLHQQGLSVTVRNQSVLEQLILIDIYTYSRCTTLLMVPAAEMTSPSDFYPLAHNCHHHHHFATHHHEFFSVVVSCPENADFAFAKFEFDSTLVTEWNWVH